jgi:CBS domain containing-hemolysin-like protein
LSFTIAFTLITAGHLVLGEQVPKIFAIREPERLAIWSAAPMRAFYVASYPLLRALDAASSSILRLLGVGQVSEHEHHSVEEIRALLGHARTHGQLSSWEHKLVEAAFEFDDILCRQIMVPRNDVVFFDVGDPLAKFLNIAKRTLHTRYPVCDGSLDKALGTVHMKDLVGVRPEAEFDLRSVMRPPKYVPETMRVSRLLGHFQATHQHLAFVVDEFGAVIGVVTLENVLEQIIGPVQDEFDVETPDIVPDGPQRWLVSGGTPVHKLGELLEEKIEVEDVDTVAGLIALELGRIPVQGDRVELGDAVLEVIEAEKNRVHRVRMEFLRQNPESPSDPTEPESG